MKKTDDESKTVAGKKPVDVAEPQVPERTAVAGGTGAAPDPGLTPDPNQDASRAAALDTYNQKVAAGEDPGEKPVDPVALSNKPKRIATGPVADGMRRVKVLSPVSTVAGAYEPGEVFDISESEADSLGANVEAIEADDAPAKGKAKK